MEGKGKIGGKNLLSSLQNNACLISIVSNVSSQSSEHIEEPYERITIEESERIPNNNPQGEHVWMMNDVVSDSSQIPAWWHEVPNKGDGNKPRQCLHH
ncbi:uncharacterized protein LOC109832868 isoform X2 [Asparagus officinalis]|uniref:uncharacterized protein LOC109832868 isoform X2 n=1 Tax=Asparagus officinalis TaxID=4686 RepID=UPI00098E27FF|nr:uncharacterized protein LOC109832868 isoform X2 [Asparagus officinalis]